MLGTRRLAAAALCTALAISGSAQAGAWQTAGSLSTPRFYHTQTTLQDGTVIVVGGDNNPELLQQSGSALSSVERFDPNTGIWTPDGSLNEARMLHTAALLTDGTVLVAGGFGFLGPLASTELYSPSGSTTPGTWSETGPLTTGRADNSLTLLPDGSVLAAGGLDANYNVLTSAERYFPSTGLWADAGQMVNPHNYPNAVLISSGLVLLCDPSPGPGACELYDPSASPASAWTSTDAPGIGFNGQLLALLPSGQVLAFGSGSSDAELYDPGSGQWTETGGWRDGQYPVVGQLLDDGCVLGAGGFFSDTVGFAALYNPALGTWTPTDSMAYGRYFATSSVLANRQVLVAGGITFSDYVAQSEIFTPPPGINPAAATVLPGASQSFAGVGGTPGASGYTWAFADGGKLSGGTIDGSGNYVAGAIGGVQDIIQVTDSLGLSGTAVVTVAAPVLTLTANSTVPNDECSNVSTDSVSQAVALCAIAAAGDVSITLSVTGDFPVEWLNAGIGQFVTPTQSGDVYTFTADQLPAYPYNDLYAFVIGDTSINALVRINVQPGLTPIAVSPASASTSPSSALSFSVSGGAPVSDFQYGYTWAFAPGGNNSNGALDQNGNYQSGTTGQVTDTIQVTDAYGSSASATISVGPTPVVTLTANSTTPSVSCTNVTSQNSTGYCEIAAGQDVSFTVGEQNSSDSIVWYLSNETSFDTVTPIQNGSTYSLPAGSLSVGFPNTLYAELASDAGIYGSILIWIDSAPLVLSPSSALVQPGASLGLTVSGGVAPYSWSMVTNPSGGVVNSTGDSSTATYAAGLGIGVQDIVRVSDSSGTTMTSTINVPGATQVVGCNSQTVVYSPALSTSGLLMFEDNWPASGDLDFNDQTIAYNDELVLDGSQNVTQMKVNLSVLAIGASIHNGISLHLPLPASTAVTALLTIGSDSTSITPFTGAGDPDLVFNLVSDTRSLFAQQDKFINTDVTIATQTGTPITLTLIFGTAVALDPSLAPYDLFIAQTANPAHEIHLPQYPGTASMDTTLFDTVDDASSTTGGLHFINGDGLPFALALPDVIAWPQEMVSIDQVYSDIVEFGSSGGVFNQDWYANGADGPHAFTAGPAPTAPIDLLICE